MRFLFLLLLCLSATAQPGPIPLRSVDAWAAGIPYPQTITPAYYWTMADLPVGGTVSNWVDRIRGLAWVTDASKNNPTNSSLGVWFDGTMCLTNSGTILKAKAHCSLFVIVERTAQDNLLKGIVSEKGFSGQGNIGAYSFVTTLATGLAFAANTAVTGLTAGKDVKTNSFLTIVTDDNNGGSQTTVYTNGVLAVANLAMPDPTAIDFNALGTDKGTAGRFLIGYIKELAWYTNSLSSTVASNLNYYATNTYGYTP